MYQFGNDLSPEQRVAVMLGLLATLCGILAVALTYLGSTAGYLAMGVCIVAALGLLAAAGARVRVVVAASKERPAAR